MKFGQELEDNIYEPWRFEYMAYNAIKKYMKERQMQHGWTDYDEDEFRATLQLEAEKVDHFITGKQRELDSRISYCDRILLHNRPHTANEGTQSLFEKMDDSLTDVLMDLNDLSKFTRYNYLAFQKLVKKHDKYTQRSAQPLLVQIMRSNPLDQQRFDVALVKLSELHDLCRQHGQQRQGNSAAGGDQNAFERATAKYWIHPDNVTEVKSILLFNLPVLVFNREKPAEASDMAVSSVYFDNEEFELYNGRLQRDEGAEAIRFRWYGAMDSPNIFIERKTHHAAWLDGASVKDRFRIDEDKVHDYITGAYSADNYTDSLRQQGMDETTVKANDFIAQGVQKSIHEKQLEQVLRVFYNRTAFQVPGDQRLRISLDTDLTFVREDEGRTAGGWRRPDMGISHFDALPPEDVYRFPYAVLETKLQTHLGQKPPEWLTRLLASNLVYEVPRFSKYLEGSAHFFSSRLPLIPWWLGQVDMDIRNAKSTKNDFTGLSRSKSLKPLIDGHYRIGYLESQLEKQATLQRMTSVQRMASQRTARSGASMERLTPTLSREPLRRHGASMRRNPATTLGNDSVVVTVDPFRDPSLSTPSQTTGMQSRSQFFESSNAFSEKPGLESSEGLGKDEEKLRRREVKKQEKRERRLQARNERQEPKVFFANERTFINWLQFSALILTAALTLLNFGDRTSTIAGGTFFGISLIIALYAFGRYRVRAHQISTRPHLRYDDLYGPIGLCILLVGALLLNFIIRYTNPSTSGSYLGINNQTHQQEPSSADAPSAAPAPTPGQYQNPVM